MKTLAPHCSLYKVSWNGIQGEPAKEMEVETTSAKSAAQTFSAQYLSNADVSVSFHDNNGMSNDGWRFCVSSYAVGHFIYVSKIIKKIDAFQAVRLIMDKTSKGDALEVIAKLAEAQKISKEMEEKLENLVADVLFPMINE